VLAELFVAILAGDAGVGALGETLGVSLIIPLPTEQEHKGERNEAVSIRVRNKDEGREHHRKIPIIYTAVGAASVFHKPSLEWAEKEDAYHIANTVSKSDKDKYAGVNDVCEIKRPDRAVEGKPSRRDGKGAPRGLEGGLFLFSRDKIAGKLLLAAGAFKLGGKESASHFNGVDYPYKRKEEGQSLAVFEKYPFPRCAFEYVKCGCAQKHKRADHHFDVMHR